MAKTPLTKRVSTAADVGIGATLLAVATAFSIAGAFGQAIPAGARIGLGLVGGALYAIGGHLYRRGKKATAVPAEEILKSDPRPPVVYLRSFRDDSATALVPNSAGSTLFSATRTEEQQIAEVFGELGPFIAIGRPGESLPELGAARMYVANEQWQETVADLMKRARLALYRASDTQGLKWEVQRGGELLGPTRMAFLIPRDLDYERFCAATEQVIPSIFPQKESSKLTCGTLVGIVYFHQDWQSEFIMPINPWFRTSIRKPLVPMLRMMARPIFVQAGVPWSPPPVNWTIYSTYCGITLLLPLTLMVVIALFGDLSGVLAILILFGILHGFMLLLYGCAYVLSPKNRHPILGPPCTTEPRSHLTRRPTN